MVFWIIQSQIYNKCWSGAWCLCAFSICSEVNCVIMCLWVMCWLHISLSEHGCETVEVWMRLSRCVRMCASPPSMCAWVCPGNPTWLRPKTFLSSLPPSNLTHPPLHPLSYQVLVWRALQRQEGRSGAAWPGRGGQDLGPCSPREGRTCSQWHLVSRSTGGEMTHGQMDVRGPEGEQTHAYTLIRQAHTVTHMHTGYAHIHTPTSQWCVTTPWCKNVHTHIQPSPPLEK